MTNKNTKNFYEKYHSAGIENPVADFMQKERCQILKNFLKNENGKILVVGCGSWQEMSIINNKAKAKGIDISEVAIKKAKAQYPQFNFMVADATKLPFGDKEFDGVVCSGVIEHIRKREKALAEVKRVLKKEISKAGFQIISFRGIWYHLPFGKGEKQIPRQITLPLVKLLYPLDSLLGKIFPSFGHMILLKLKK